MATPAQIAANQTNAKKSTGPRTEAGKQTTRMNAIRHGLCTFITCLDTEDPEEAERLLADLMDEHQPQGATEQILVNKMAEQFWLQKRAAYYLAQHTDYNEGAKEESEEIISMKQMALYLRYYTTAERAFNRNLHDLRRLQKDRRQHAPVTEIGSVPQNAQPPSAQPEPPAPTLANHSPVEPIFVPTDLPEPVRPHEKAA
jgi:hypothetical protein